MKKIEMGAVMGRCFNCGFPLQVSGRWETGEGVYWVETKCLKGDKHPVDVGEEFEITPRQSPPKPWEKGYKRPDTDRGPGPMSRL